MTRTLIDAYLIILVESSRVQTMVLVSIGFRKLLAYARVKLDVNQLIAASTQKYSGGGRLQIIS